MAKRLTFHDHKPQTLSLQKAVIEGFSKQQKSIPPKFFYDERGSELFAAICRQPEYYPPDIEQAMLSQQAGEIAELTGTGRLVFEPGAGSAIKIRVLLEALQPVAYVPMDISCEFLKEAAADIVDAYPWLPVHAACVDFTHSLPIPEVAPAAPRLAFFPGSSIGNFTPTAAAEFLSMVRTQIGRDGMLLIGVDTKKDPDILNAAYNDDAGITAAFNLNLLHRIRHETGVDCNPENFEHKAYYNADLGRIEMHLVSRCQQTLRLNGYRFKLMEGETVHTENSYKYAPEEFIALAATAGLEIRRYWLGERQLFALYLFSAR